MATASAEQRIAVLDTLRGVGVLGIFLVPPWFSPWWPRNYRHGPLEWAWRAATRWEPVPLRRRAAPANGRRARRCVKRMAR